MARFSKDILHKFREMVKQMVVELGPDTEDLGLRIGLHSGPVTAGVLRGERARFQLFGDTMNTTAVSCLMLGLYSYPLYWIMLMPLLYCS